MLLTLIFCSELLTGVVPYTDLRAEAEVSFVTYSFVCYNMDCFLFFFLLLLEDFKFLIHQHGRQTWKFCLGQKHTIVLGNGTFGIIPILNNSLIFFDIELYMFNFEVVNMLKTFITVSFFPLNFLNLVVSYKNVYHESMQFIRSKSPQLLIMCADISC